MSSDRTTDRSPSDSSQNDEVYAKNDEGEPGMTRLSGDNEGLYRMHPDDVHRVADPKVYGPIMLIGAVLLLVPEPITSMVGLLLLLTGGFIWVTDALSAS